MAPDWIMIATNFVYLEEPTANICLIIYYISG